MTDGTSTATVSFGKCPACQLSITATICGRSDGLRCMIRGWGGVWACSTCLTEAVAS